MTNGKEVTKFKDARTGVAARGRTTRGAELTGGHRAIFEGRKEAA